VRQPRVHMHRDMPGPWVAFGSRSRTGGNGGGLGIWPESLTEQIRGRFGDRTSHAHKIPLLWGAHSPIASQRGGNVILGHVGSSSVGSFPTDQSSGLEGPIRAWPMSGVFNGSVGASPWPSSRRSLEPYVLFTHQSIVTGDAIHHINQKSASETMVPILVGGAYLSVPTEAIWYLI
jgi:hypothetical protein